MGAQRLAQCVQGRPDTAIAHFERASRLDSRPRKSQSSDRIGCAHFDAGRYEQAALYNSKRCGKQPAAAWINRTLSVSYARLGERLAGAGIDRGAARGTRLI